MTQEWPFPLSDTDSLGVAVKTSLPQAIESVATEFAGATEPSPTFAYQVWHDTSTGVIKQRNAANSAWVIRGKALADFSRDAINQFVWSINATTTFALLITDATVTIDDLYVAVSTTTTSDGSNHWTVQVTNATDSLNLKAAAFTTNGNDFTAHVPKAIGLDQNKTIVAGKVIRVTFTKVSAGDDLTDMVLQLRLTRAS